MGMFDYLRCTMPLPAPDCEGMEFQTKDTPMQYMEQYEIRDDGTLWFHASQVENISVPKAKGVMRFFRPKPPTTRTIQRWERVTDLTGEIVFYGDREDESWVEFSAHFVNGQLQQLTCIRDERPQVNAT